MKFEETITAEDAIKRWDDGDTLWSIELGGIGPGYEQCIHVAAIEILRGAIKATADVFLDSEAFQKIADETVTKIKPGLSGAQAGCALQLAFKAYTLGWSGMLRQANEQFEKEGQEDRFILISNHWPRAVRLES